MGKEEQHALATPLAPLGSRFRRAREVDLIGNRAARDTLVAARGCSSRLSDAAMGSLEREKDRRRPDGRDDHSR